MGNVWYGFQAVFVRRTAPDSPHQQRPPFSTNSMPRTVAPFRPSFSADACRRTQRPASGSPLIGRRDAVPDLPSSMRSTPQ